MWKHSTVELMDGEDEYIYRNKRGEAIEQSCGTIKHMIVCQKKNAFIWS